MSSAAKPTERRVYFLLALIMVATVVWGFWRSYYGPIVRGNMDQPWIIHVHAAAFTVWMLLFLVQPSLASLGRKDLHQRVGMVVMSYGLMVLAIGIAAGIAMPVKRVLAGQMPLDRAALVALYNLTDILAFGGFLLAAALRRRQPEWHKRLIICAMVALTGAAVGRVLPSGSFLYLFLWLLPLALMIATDMVRLRRLHPVSVIGVLVFAVVANKVLIMSASPVWRNIGGTLIRPFL